MNEPPRRLPAAERALQLLDAAASLFGSQGYDGTSIEQIARAAGISRPVVYEHYGSKAGIYLACVRRAREQLAADFIKGIGDATTAYDRLKGGIDGYFRFVEDDPLRWSVIFEGVAVTGEVAEQALRMRDETVHMIGILIRESRPDLSDDEADGFAHALSGAGEQLGRWWNRHRDVPREVVAGYLFRFAYYGLNPTPSELTDDHDTRR